MNHIGSPLLFAKALSTISDEGMAYAVTSQLKADFRMDPSEIIDVSRAHQRQEHVMHSKLSWEDDELANCAATMSQSTVDVIDRDDFTRQTVEQPEVQAITVHVDLTDPRDPETASGTMTVSFDEDGEFVVGGTTGIMHDPGAQAIATHALRDHMRRCCEVGWDIERDNEQRHQQTSLDL